MKKFLCVFMLVLLCACSGNKQVKPAMRGISFTAAVCCYNEMYECSVEVDSEGGAVMRVVSPEELSGLKFICKGESVTAEFLGLSYTPDFNKMPSGAVVKMLYGILCDCNSDVISAEEDGGNYCVKGRVGERAYNLMITPSGLPISAQIPDESYIIDFKNVTLK